MSDFFKTKEFNDIINKSALHDALAEKIRQQVDEIQALKAQLESARKVIEFYSEKSHWGIGGVGESVSIDPCDHLKRVNYDKVTKEAYIDSVVGGKRARNWLLQNKESK